MPQHAAAASAPPWLGRAKVEDHISLYVGSRVLGPPAHSNRPPGGDSLCKFPFKPRMKKITAPLRRAFIYGFVSYGCLVLINNSELNLPNMWVAYLPMFVGVYVLTQWLDRKIGG
jgi:hypothetical protein